MKIKTLIIDDEDLAADMIERFLLDYKEIEIIGKHYSSDKALTAIELLKPDLIFADIQMPKLTGVELIKQITYKPLIIFTTAFSEYAIEAFELNVLDYIVKPISIKRFNKSVDKAILQFQLQQYSDLIYRNDKSIVLKKDGLEHKVNYNDITHIEAMRQYVIIHTSVSKFYLNDTLKNTEIEFAKFDFVRVHKSFMINKTKVSKVSATSVLLEKIKIPIGRSYKSFLK